MLNLVDQDDVAFTSAKSNTDNVKYWVLVREFMIYPDLRTLN